MNAVDAIRQASISTDQKKDLVKFVWRTAGPKTLLVTGQEILNVGYDPIWFGIIVVKMCEVCLITPPIGLNCYVVAGVRPDIPLNEVFKGIGPFFIADLITLGVFLAWPETITWLPDLMIKKW